MGGPLREPRGRDALARLQVVRRPRPRPGPDRLVFFDDARAVADWDAQFVSPVALERRDRQEVDAVRRRTRAYCGSSSARQERQAMLRAETYTRSCSGAFGGENKRVCRGRRAKQASPDGRGRRRGGGPRLRGSAEGTSSSVVTQRRGRRARLRRRRGLDRIIGDPRGVAGRPSAGDARAPSSGALGSSPCPSPRGGVYIFTTAQPSRRARLRRRQRRRRARRSARRRAAPDARRARARRGATTRRRARCRRPRHAEARARS